MGNVDRYKSRRPIQRLAQFAPPRLLEGEDAAAYDDFLAGIFAAVQPDDIIRELLVADAVSSQWEAWRWRRLKFVLIRGEGYKALKAFLIDTRLHYSLFKEAYEQALAETLQDLIEDQAEESAESLAYRCASNEGDAIDRADAVDKANELLEAVNLDIEKIQDRAEDKKAEELAHACARREPDALKQVNEILKDNGRTMDDFVAEGLFTQLSKTVDCLTAIERFDRLIIVAENRRDASLREIDRHKAALGEAMRNKLKEIEATELQEIGQPTRGERSNAA